MRLNGDVLVIMAKYPEPGRVKTRLARELGTIEACELYRAFVLDLAHRRWPRAWTVVWAVDPPGADLAPLVGFELLQIPQLGDDLGSRMLHCFQSLLGAGGRRVVMLGADAPHLGDERIDEAFSRLIDHDVALVPTRDGGYCAVGLKQAHDIFSGIPMGTRSVFAGTSKLIRRRALRLAELPMSFDVDDVADLGELAAEVARRPGALPHTMSVMRKLSRHLPTLAKMPD